MAHGLDRRAAQVLGGTQAPHPNCSAGKPGWSEEGGFSQRRDAATFVALSMSLCTPSTRVHPIHARKTLPNASLCLEGMT